MSLFHPPSTRCAQSVSFTKGEDFDFLMHDVYATFVKIQYILDQTLIFILIAGQLS